jgi:hypothetical protein
MAKRSSSFLAAKKTQRRDIENAKILAAGYKARKRITAGKSVRKH